MPVGSGRPYGQNKCLNRKENGPMNVKTKTVAGVALAAVFGSGAALADEGTLDIVFINDGHVAPYHVAWLSGFDDAIAAYDEAFPDLEVTGRWLSAEGSLERMIQQVEVTINENPDIMYVNAINVDAFEPLVARAQEQGIVWIAVHSPMDSADYSFTLGDVTNGRNQGMAMCALSGGEPFQVGIMLGQAGNPSGEARRAGILEGIGMLCILLIMCDGCAAIFCMMGRLFQ